MSVLWMLHSRREINGLNLEVLTVNLKLVGSSLIVAGTALGAGMLAIPMVLAQFGLLWGTLLMLFIWLEPLMPLCFYLKRVAKSVVA